MKEVLQPTDTEYIKMRTRAAQFMLVSFFGCVSFVGTGAAVYKLNAQELPDTTEARACQPESPGVETRRCLLSTADYDEIIARADDVTEHNVHEAYNGLMAGLIAGFSSGLVMAIGTASGYVTITINQNEQSRGNN